MASHGLTFAQAREVVLADRRLHHPHARPGGERAVRSGPAAEIPRSEDPAAWGSRGRSSSPSAGVRRRTSGGVRHDGVRPPVVGVRATAWRSSTPRPPGRCGRICGPELPEEEVPIRAITNGIHTRSWLSHEMVELLHAVLRAAVPREARGPSGVGAGGGDPRRGALADPRVAAASGSSSSPASGSESSLRRQGAGAELQRAAEEVLNPEALTIGFSRRFATYKRANLLFRQPERLIRLLDEPGPAGADPLRRKGAPAGPRRRRRSSGRSSISPSDPRVRDRLVFLEDYDINVARYLVQGGRRVAEQPAAPAGGVAGPAG